MTWYPSLASFILLFLCTPLYYVLGTWLFSHYLQPKSLIVTNTIHETQITYRHFRLFTLMLAGMALTGIVLAATLLVVEPVAEETFLTIILFSGLVLFSAVFLTHDLFTKTVITVADNQISYYQRLNFGAKKRQARIGANVIRVYYAKLSTRHTQNGSKYSIFVDTTNQLRVLLLQEIYDEQVAVLIKDTIIARYKLAWSSKMGVGHLLEENWYGKLK